MGWITDINFKETFTNNGVTVTGGSATQVRWDLGIGDISIGHEGRIREVKMIHPVQGTDREEYEKVLLNFSGFLDTTEGLLLFKDGKVTDLDFSNGFILRDYLHTGLHALGLCITATHKTSDGTIIQANNPQIDKIIEAIAIMRQELNDGIIRASCKEIDETYLFHDWDNKKFP